MHGVPNRRPGGMFCRCGTGYGWEHEVCRGRLIPRGCFAQPATLRSCLRDKSRPARATKASDATPPAEAKGGVSVGRSALRYVSVEHGAAALAMRAADRLVAHAADDLGERPEHAVGGVVPARLHADVVL